MRLRFAAALVTAALAAVTVVPQLSAQGAPGADGAARVTVDQSYPVPASGTFTVRGHGWGHGHGMSQWGAQGAALDGLTFERILAFYYPGTTLGSASRKVRVLITGDTTSDVVVLAQDGLRVRDLGAGRTYRLPTNLAATRWRLDVGADNRTVVEYLADGTWRPWRPGGDAALSGNGEFRGGGAPITLVKPSGTTTYRGFLRSVPPSPGSTARDTVNVVPLDGYVKGVVPREVYTSWRPAALQAQAVAARTYAAFERAANQTRYYQICDTSSCQVYGGVDDEVASTNDAVDATAKQILLYDGGPAFTQFSASSGGWTSADGVRPYLTAQPDPYDDAPGNPVHDWSVAVKASTIRGHWPSVGTLRRIRVTARDGNGQWQGRVVTMVLVGSERNVTVSGDTFRSVLGLRSTWFTFG